MKQRKEKFYQQPPQQVSLLLLERKYLDKYDTYLIFENEDTLA